MGHPAVIIALVDIKNITHSAVSWADGGVVNGKRSGGLFSHRSWWPLLKLMLAALSAKSHFAVTALKPQDSDETHSMGKLAAASLALGLLVLMKVVLCRTDVDSYLGELLLLWHQGSSRQTLDIEIYDIKN